MVEASLVSFSSNRTETHLFVTRYGCYRSPVHQIGFSTICHKIGGDR